MGTCFISSSCFLWGLIHSRTAAYWSSLVQWNLRSKSAECRSGIDGSFVSINSSAVGCAPPECQPWWVWLPNRGHLSFCNSPCVVRGHIWLVLGSLRIPCACVWDPAVGEIDLDLPECVRGGPFGKGPFGVWVLAWLRSSNLYVIFLDFPREIWSTVNHNLSLFHFLNRYWDKYLWYYTIIIVIAMITSL